MATTGSRGRSRQAPRYPLTSEELADLYATTGEIAPAEERQLTAELPDPARLLTADQFAGLVAALESSEPPEDAVLWARPATKAELPALERFSQLAGSVSAELERLVPWQRAAVAAGYAGGNDRELWVTLGRHVIEAVQYWDSTKPILTEYDIELGPGLTSVEAQRELTGIIGRLTNGSKLGSLPLLLHPGWKRLIKAVRVNGRAPTELPHFRAIEAQFALLDHRQRLAHRWQRQAEPAGLPRFEAVATPPEPKLRAYVSQFDHLLAWWPERWSSIRAAAQAAGFDWEAFRRREVARAGPMDPFERDAGLLSAAVPRLSRSRLAMADRDTALRLLSDLERFLADYPGPACVAMSRAVRDRDPVAYEAAAKALQVLRLKAERWRRRKELLGRLAECAPVWAAAVAGREGLHGADTVPGDAGAAWVWRQLRQEIDRRADLDEVSLTRRLRERREALRRTTTELIDRRAWLEQLRRADLSARQALQGWADTQRRIGRGTGKRVPELQARARELLVEAQTAVPVWIMPLARAAESFDPRQGRFDVVILDEASQSDVTGLFAWYLGKQIAVVGDHEQVSPSAVGQNLNTVSALINQYLDGIPNSHLYDGQTSVYHLARTSFGGTLALREHFRCVPDIIEFSNRLAYDGEIRPLRDAGSAVRPHVAEYVVPESAERVGKQNLAEARTVAALLKAMSELPEYSGQSMGAITLLGDEQAGLMQDLAVRLVGAVELEQRRFAAGNSAQFQGDERDVVFLSMVDTPGESPLTLRQTPAFKQRYNVAASRARNQLWLVHSLDPGRDLKPGDLRRTLIEHVRDPGARRRALQEAEGRAESEFEAEVIRRLVGAGYRVTPQVWVGRYRLDMVVSDANGQVAIECDGDRFHGFDQIPQDMARQAVLERAGWRFIRIRGTRFYRDRDGTTEWVLGELGRLEIEPAGPVADGQEPDTAGRELREKVVRRAHEIMREERWLPTEEALEAQDPTGPEGINV